MRKMSRQGESEASEETPAEEDETLLLRYGVSRVLLQLKQRFNETKNDL